jgi:hypothetical protein
MNAWLDESCGADGWAMTPSGLRGVVNDAVAVYFSDTALASAFVSRWCAGQKPETIEGAFRFRDDMTAVQLLEAKPWRIIRTPRSRTQSTANPRIARRALRG